MLERVQEQLRRSKPSKRQQCIDDALVYLAAMESSRERVLEHAHWLETRQLAKSDIEAARKLRKILTGGRG